MEKKKIQNKAVKKETTEKKVTEKKSTKLDESKLKDKNDIVLSKDGKTYSVTKEMAIILINKGAAKLK